MNLLRRKKPLPELRKIVNAQIQGLDSVDDAPQTFTVMTYSIPPHLHAIVFLYSIYIYIYIF